MIKNFLFTVCTLCFLLSLSQTALACFCSYATVRDTYSTSDAVFVGKVIKIRTVKMASAGLTVKWSSNIKQLDNGKWEKSIENVRRVTLEIIEPFKGVREKTFDLITNVYNGGGSCGVPFKVRESYLVFASELQPGLSKEEAEQPKETWTLEMKLNEEADKFNEHLPQYGTGICSRTENLRFMKNDVLEIRNFLKDGAWKEPETSSPFMPPLSPL